MSPEPTQPHAAASRTLNVVFALDDTATPICRKVALFRAKVEAMRLRFGICRRDGRLYRGVSGGWRA
jgi:hypothetical protein